MKHLCWRLKRLLLGENKNLVQNAAPCADIFFNHILDDANCIKLELLYVNCDNRAGTYRQAMRIKNRFGQEQETIVVKDIHYR